MEKNDKIFQSLDEFDDLIDSEFGDDGNARRSLNNLVQSSNPDWREAQKAGIQAKTQTDEWKENQLHGTRTVRASNTNWQKNVRDGAQKRENADSFNRLELNRKVMQTEKWRKAQKEGSANRLSKPENLTECPHCDKVVDNANYKRWHGDNCKSKP
jgi:hypothetical protein